MRKKVAFAHIISLVYIITRFILWSKFQMQFNPIIHYSFFITWVFSGVFLALTYLKPFRPIGIYYSVYILWLILLPLSKLIDGIFFGIIASISMGMALVPSTELSDDRYEIKSEFTGLFGGCCRYGIYESGMLYDKRINGFRLEHQSIDSFQYDEKLFYVKFNDKETLMVFREPVQN